MRIFFTREMDLSNGHHNKDSKNMFSSIRTVGFPLEFLEKCLWNESIGLSFIRSHAIEHKPLAPIGSWTSLNHFFVCFCNVGLIDQGFKWTTEV